ncbi:major facilitator superfamily domain-containing protein [Phlyctochytrium arcticum]|nr:major facilitator superfamily domain-containing protein [Phlyctochytrium arcticum]
MVEKDASQTTLQHHSDLPTNNNLTQRHTLNNVDAEAVPTQAGVSNVEAVTNTFTRTDFWIIYVGLLLVAYVTSLDGQSFWTLEPFITSNFKAHSMLVVLPTVNAIVGAVSKFPLVKIADTFGRVEAYVFSLFCFCLGYIIMCKVTTFGAFAGASVFYSIGSSGIMLMQQLIIADTTSLANRGFLSSLPDTPFLINTWVGPLYATAFLPDHWRWTMGLIIILLPLTSLFVIGPLIWVERKARRAGKIRQPIVWNKKFLVDFFMGMDLVGCLLLAGAWSLILFALLRAPYYDGGYKDGSVIAMIVSGVLIHGLLFFWEKRYATYPILPLRVVKNRTALGGLLCVFFMFMSWYTYTSYLTSYLYVTRDLDFDKSQWITNAWMFSSVISSIAIGLVMKYHRRFLIYGWIGLAANMIGNGLMINFRGPKNPAIEIIFSQILAGIGAGLITTAVQVGAQAAVPHQDVAIVTGIFLSIASIGGAIGSAIAGTIWKNQLPNELLARGVPADDIVTILSSVMDAQTMKATYPGISDAYTVVTKNINIASLCLLIPIAVGLALMRNLALPDDEVAAISVDPTTEKKQVNGTLNSPQ